MAFQAVGQREAEPLTEQHAFALVHESGNTEFFILPKDSMPGTFKAVQLSSTKSFSVFQQLDIFGVSSVKPSGLNVYEILGTTDFTAIKVLASAAKQEIVATILVEEPLRANHSIFPDNDKRNLKVGYNDTLIFLLLLNLGLLSAFRVLYPKRFSEVFSLRRTFSLRPLESDSFRLRLFDRDTISAIFIYVLLTGVVITLFSSSDYDIFEVNQRMALSIAFIKSVVILSFLVTAKIFLVTVLANIYGVRKMNLFYVKELINISLLFITILFFATIIVFLWSGSMPAFWLLTIKVTLIILYIIRSILLYFKILKLSGFTYLYLFSYFCTTEIFPLIIGLKYFY